MPGACLDRATGATTMSASRVQAAACRLGLREVILNSISQKEKIREEKTGVGKGIKAPRDFFQNAGPLESHLHGLFCPNSCPVPTYTMEQNLGGQGGNTAF